MGLYRSYTVTAETVLTSLRLQGAILRLEGDTLRIQMTGGIPGDLVPVLKEHGDAIKGILRQQEGAQEMEPQLDRGMDVLRQMERAGKVGTSEYENARLYFIALLCKYELLSEGKVAS